jgi:hypothetical protein
MVGGRGTGGSRPRLRPGTSALHEAPSSARAARRCAPVERDEMLEALVAGGPPDPLGDRVRPRRPHRGEHRLAAQPGCPSDVVSTVCGVRIPHGVPRPPGPDGERRQVAPDSGSSRPHGEVRVHQRAPLGRDQEERVARAKRQRRHRGEAGGPGGPGPAGGPASPASGASVGAGWPTGWPTAASSRVVGAVSGRLVARRQSPAPGPRSVHRYGVTARRGRRHGAGRGCRSPHGGNVISAPLTTPRAERQIARGRATRPGSSSVHVRSLQGIGGADAPHAAPAPRAPVAREHARRRVRREAPRRPSGRCGGAHLVGER